jgi:hypothetical protein
MLPPRAWLGLGLACLLLLVGCKGKVAEPPCYPVRGKVYYRGKPAAGVDVYFHPAEERDAKAQRPHSKTDANGEFQLTTRRRNDGAPEGEYLITFFWAAAENVEEPEDRLKGRYLNPRQSRWRVAVKPSTNEVDPFLLD